VKLRPLSPLGFLALAAAIVAVFGVLHLAGLRADASILSGTAPPDAAGPLLGVSYVLAYFAAVILAPILTLAAGVMELSLRWMKRRSGP
jgi:hypothetical protein